MIPGVYPFPPPIIETPRCHIFGCIRSEGHERQGLMTDRHHTDGLKVLDTFEQRKRQVEFEAGLKRDENREQLADFVQVCQLLYAAYIADDVLLVRTTIEEIGERLRLRRKAGE